MRRVLLLVGLMACSSETTGSDTSGAVTPSSQGGGATKGGGGTAAPEKGVPKDTASAASSGASDTPPAVANNCTGDPGTFYALTVGKLDSTETLPLCTYQGAVVLVVNGASGCGYTPQYKPLEALYTKYATTGHQKFEVLAFPSKSFNQEKDTDAEVSSFCTKEYSITFPLATIGPVVDNTTKSETAQPVYKWLYAQPGMSAPVSWNFEKFLVGKDGKVVKRWLSAVSPDDGGEIDKAIATELAK